MSTEEMTPQQRAAATKRRRTNAWVCDAARKLFDERGYHGVTREDIAAESGMGSSTVFKHFPTKRALAVAAYAPEVLALMASAEKELADKASPEAVLTHFIQELVAYLVAHPAMAYTLLPLSRDVRTPDDESILAVNIRNLVELVTRMLDNCQNEDNAEFALFGMLTWIVHHQGHDHCGEEAAYLAQRYLL